MCFAQQKTRCFIKWCLNINVMHNSIHSFFLFKNNSHEVGFISLLVWTLTKCYNCEQLTVYFVSKGNCPTCSPLDSKYGGVGKIHATGPIGFPGRTKLGSRGAHGITSGGVRCNLACWCFEWRSWIINLRMDENLVKMLPQSHVTWTQVIVQIHLIFPKNNYFWQMRKPCCTTPCLPPMGQTFRHKCRIMKFLIVWNCVARLIMSFTAWLHHVALSAIYFWHNKITL